MRASAPTGFQHPRKGRHTGRPLRTDKGPSHPRRDAPTTARAARSEAERAEGGTSGTLVTEILGAPQRETVKEKQTKCVLAPRCPPHPPPRDGSIDPAEGPSVPEGRAKSALAPIRRPPSRAEGHCTGARQSVFSLWTVHGPFLFWQDQKRNGGCICPAISMAESPGRLVTAPTGPAGAPPKKKTAGPPPSRLVFPDRK